jgi:rod shape-determining protein MreB
MLRRHRLTIGLASAEELKIAVGSARPRADRLAEVRGRFLPTGLPRTVVVDGEEIAGALDEPLSRILSAIRGSLDRTPPDLAADILDVGIMLSGGGALLHGLPDRLRAELGLPVHVSDDPLGAVARGAGMALEEVREMRRAGRDPFTSR